MTKNCRALVAQVMLAVLAANIGHARTVSPNEVRTAAETWLRTSGIALSVLAGRSVGAIEPRGGIWLARLNPSGYVILSSSDLAAPIIAFSDKTFFEPEPGSAFFDILHGAETGHARLRGESPPPLVTPGESRKTQSIRTPDGRATHRKARWEALLGVESSTTNRTTRLAQTAAPPSSGVVIAPFLSTRWNQWQPWNDFAPVCDPIGIDAYRGRCPCGCVSTAAAQALAYWKWPIYADQGGVVPGKFTKRNGEVADWLMRISGNQPMQWDGLLQSDIGRLNGDRGCDLRGTIAESQRYPLARIVFLCSWLGEMHFKPEGSSARFHMVAGHSPWYEQSRWVNLNSDYEGAVSALKTDLVDKAPVQVTVPGHAVVGCGWAEEFGDHYIYLNYGWSGSNDGYYNIDDQHSDASIQEACVGFKPRRMVQIKPVPRVVNDAVLLEWEQPECHRASTSGFTVSAERRSTTLSEVYDPFETLSGRTYGEGVALAADAEHGDGTPALRMSATKCSCYELPDDFMLTSRSVLSFEVYSEKMISHEMRIEMYADGAWTSVSAPRLCDYDEVKTRMHIVVPLCDQGGKLVRFRIVCDYTGSGYYSDGYAWVDNFRVSDVYAYERESVSRVGGQFRNALIGLRPGSDYLLSVKPDESPACDAAVVMTSTAGETDIPVPGEVRYEPFDLAFGDDAFGYHWFAEGSSVSSDEIATGIWEGGFSVNLPNPLADGSRLAFDWMVTGLYDKPDRFDEFSVSFNDSKGEKTEIWSLVNREDVSEVRNVDLPLGTLVGRTGVLSVRFKHRGSQWSVAGARFLRPKLIGVTRLQLDAEPRQARAVRRPSSPVLIQEVVPVNGKIEEGFFVNCARGVNKLHVRCSPNVCMLKALPSCLSLVSDRHVFIRPTGNGEFDVFVNGSDIPPSADRSRMILTLVACDANGTSAAKDLVLRFSSETSAYGCGLIRFLSEDETGEMPDLPMDRETVCALPRARLTMPGKRFAGWLCSKNGRRYDDGVLVFNLAEPGETVTMTAVWE